MIDEFRQLSIPSKVQVLERLWYNVDRKLSFLEGAEDPVNELFSVSLKSGLK